MRRIVWVGLCFALIGCGGREGRVAHPTCDCAEKDRKNDSQSDSSSREDISVREDGLSVERSCQEAHTHAHHHVAPSSAPVPPGAHGIVIPHEGLPAFENNGNSLVGLATRARGAQSFEVWRSRVAPGGATPPHVHETEEVFVVLTGKGELLVGDQVIPFEAPATVIAPAGVVHQLRNTGDEPTDQIVIVGADSVIRDTKGNVMDLPWRK